MEIEELYASRFICMSIRLARVDHRFPEPQHTCQLDVYLSHKRRACIYVW